MTKVNLSAGVSIILCLYYASWCLYYGTPDHWLRRRRGWVRPETCLKGLRPAPFTTALLQHIYGNVESKYISSAQTTLPCEVSCKVVSLRESAMGVGNAHWAWGSQILRLT